MYCLDPFAETRPEILRALIQRYPLAALVSMGGNGLEANHIPLYLVPDEAPQPVLQGHVARANPLWREVSPDDEVLVIFQGPQHYISPSWYATKAETGKVVPTWNYAVVHAYGPLHVKDDPAWVRQQMVALTAQQESGFTLPWQVGDAPRDFTERLIQQVVGIEIPISRWMGKWKVSQNQPVGNRDTVVAHLGQQKQPDSGAMAEYVLASLKDGKKGHPG
ncbi:MAG: FMN-binding negative transcriptional regulator [Acidithiobacillus ferrooxidans]|nr:FMN-binding negative transcriptional regulator [Acidithiobacillus ferrooxidans]MDD5004315.1 FMN-binding negative transcriptional regulator [Acidithiobacillus sp.]MDD5379522.1 FMN-binding negative transcriptional regulator [Acidithiobacillus sp.]MDD5576638.1 FMN-binding negative transcriptional regulator [Acidithiobacillus sp.]